MAVPIVSSSSPVNKDGVEEAKLLGECFLEVLEEMGDSTVRFFGEERREFVEGEFEKIPEGAKDLLYVPAWTFFNASYIVGRPAVDGAEAAGTGAAMIYSSSKDAEFASEEFWMGVSGMLAGAGALMGTFAIAASPKPPISLTAIPTDISMSMSASGSRGAMAPALAVSVSTTAVPAVSTEAAAAVVGNMTGSTLMMYSAGEQSAVEWQRQVEHEHSEPSPWLDDRDPPISKDMPPSKKYYTEALSKKTAEVIHSEMKNAKKAKMGNEEVFIFDGSELNAKIRYEFRRKKGHLLDGHHPQVHFENIRTMIKHQLRIANAWFKAHDVNWSLFLSDESLF